MEENNVNGQPVEAPAAPKVDKKKFVTVGIVVLAAVVVGLAWYLISSSGSAKADEAIALADTEYNDSIALARYIDAAKLGHKSGNRAKLEAAIALYRKADYQGALNYLKDASTSSSVVEAGKYALMGDCYVNLENYDEALSSYNKAISAADNNPQIVPFVLVKEANVYRAQGKSEQEFEAYNRIYNEYPEYTGNLSVNIRKYMERARVAAGK